MPTISLIMTPFAIDLSGLGGEKQGWEEDRKLNVPKSATF